MRIRAVCCEIIYREACRTAADSPHVVDLDFLPKGLHDVGSEKMLARLQEVVDVVDPETYDATVLGYALCNNGTAGLKATRTRLVIPRAHDCITFFMGSRRAYCEYFDAHPGTYYKTTGWFERGKGGLEDDIPDQLGTNRTYREYVEKHGEENAKYIIKALGGWKTTYSQMTYIDMGFPMDDDYAVKAAVEAKENDWSFERIQGDSRLLKRLFDGPWDDEDFLTLDVGQAVDVSYDECIFRRQGERPRTEHPQQ